MLYTKKQKLKKQNNIKLLNNKKDYLKCTSKPNYMSHKIFALEFAYEIEVKY